MRLRSRRRGAEDDRRRGIEEIALRWCSPMPKTIESDLIGVLDLLDQVAQAVRRTDRAAGVVMRRCEAIDADLHQTI